MKNKTSTAGGRPNGKWASPEVKQRFLELVHEGVSIREASRIVGLNRRTGQEWLRPARSSLQGARRGDHCGPLRSRRADDL
ncbi:helix-turn-helix domain-containing protein [Streptomyces sp. NPDC019507]|uniref:helix-turn-helix domain-containing protein n=1 Tax=Streptomyces sp. NPDC019507 TaxID=3154689 RepID=UPI0033EB4DAF